VKKKLSTTRGCEADCREDMDVEYHVGGALVQRMKEVSVWERRVSVQNTECETNMWDYGECLHSNIQH
jgi:hypothetical protein